MRVDLLVTNASELLTMADGPDGPLRGDDLCSPGCIEGGAVAIRAGAIEAVGTTEELTERCEPDAVLDAEGCVVREGDASSAHDVHVGLQEGVRVLSEGLEHLRLDVQV